jgi:hypothetical protein
LEAKPFPYQELNLTVLVWHVACIRRGQFRSLGSRNGKKKRTREQGIGVAGNMKLTPDP